MKKIITLLFISCLSKAQILNILSVTPATICPGDSLTVKYKLNPGTEQGVIRLIGPGGGGQIWQYDRSYWESQPIVSSQPENIYIIKLETWPNFQHGYAYMYATGGATITIDMWCGTVNTTGIEELNPDQLKPVYYDMNGIRISRRTDELIFIEIENKRKGIIIQEQ